MMEPDEQLATTNDFYADIDPFNRFELYNKFNDYHPLPRNWTVLSVDVLDVARAIDEGRYKAVNMAGAAAITAVLNVAGETEVPYLFSGNSATVIVPPAIKKTALEALFGLQAHAQEMFGFDVRVGAVRGEQLRERRAHIGIRKFQLTAGNNVAMFAGTGLRVAEDLVRGVEHGNAFCPQPDTPPAPPNLEGLSCRWEPLKSQNGVTLALIVEEISTFSRDELPVIQKTLETILDSSSEAGRDPSPASPGALHFRWPPRGLWQEALLTKAFKSVPRAMAEKLSTSAIQKFCHGFGIKVGDYDGAHYVDEMRANVDYRKYDGSLRLVIDVTPEHADAIEAYLADEFGKGKLAYGLHRASSAYMSCLVFSLAESQHIHFVDASGGGFAIAAIDYKRRREALMLGDEAEGGNGH